MPRVAVAADATNKNILTLMSNAAPITGWINDGSLQADSDNGDILKIGGSGMTATNYDVELAAGESLGIDAPMFLRSKYVRNDSGAEQHLIINGNMT